MNIRTPDNRCRLVAEIQHGVLSRDQALEAGLTPACIKGRLACGAWAKVFPGVYRIQGYPLTWRARAMAAQLWAGRDACVSHGGAARLMRLDGFAGAPLEVSCRRRARPPTGIRAHTSVDDGDITAFDGIRITRAARTLLDLSATEPMRRVEFALDCALRRKLTSVEELSQRLDRSRGRRGVRPLVALLAVRQTGHVSDTGLETRFLRLVLDGGQPAPIAQYVISERGIVMAEFDFAYPDLLIGIEVDSYGYHSAPRDWQRDRTRQNYLVNRGWLVLRFTEYDIKHRKGYVLHTIRRARARKLTSSA